MLQSVLDEQQGAPKNVLRIIETISKHNNTPRKKPKFVNFVKNVCGHKTNPKDIDQAWDLISVKLTALSNANQQNKNNKAQSNEDKETNETDKGINETETNEADSTQNDDEQNIENGDADDNKESDNIETEKKGKKLSKKEKKEQKKRLKYEAELQSAVEPSSEEEKVVETKKGKKKTKSESENDVTEKESKKNKRKRQDTVNSVNGNQELENNTAVVQNGVAKEKQKKKAKIDAEDEENPEESMCLHDQNVAKIGELNVNDQFNWHAVIMSVLEKKGNELPFKRLQKKVLAEYSEITGQDIDDRIADKFIKKLKSAPNVRVDKNRVLLVQ